MKTGYWVLTAIIVWSIGFAIGYKVSSSTGIQPGYFEAAEAGGYGGGEETVEGLSTEMQDYYKGLYKEEE